MAFTVLPTQSAGQTASAAGWANLVKANFEATWRLLAYKDADEPLSSNTTLQDDDKLFFTAVANEVYSFEIFLIYTDASGGSAHMKTAFTFPSGTLSLMAIDFSSSGAISTLAWTTSGVASVAHLIGTAAARVAHIRGAWLVGGTGGNLQLQWAQSVSNASLLTVKKGSVILGMKLA